MRFFDIGEQEESKINIIRLCIALALITGQGNLNAQVNSRFVDSILNLVSQNQILIYDQNIEILNQKEIVLESVDTLIDCLWSRPKYIDNVYYPAMDGFLETTPVAFDTVSNELNANYLDFWTSHYSDGGDFISDDVVFTIEKRGKKLRDSYDFGGDDEELKQTLWENRMIIDHGVNIALDSCHDKYRLALNEDFTFEQYYKDTGRKCFTDEMDNEVQVGMEGELEKFTKYGHKLEGHYIQHSKGYWDVQKDELIFFNDKWRPIITFKLVKLSGNKLVLSTRNDQYRIRLKRAKK